MTRDPYVDPKPGDRFEWRKNGEVVPFEVIRPIQCSIPGSVEVRDAGGRRRFNLRRDEDVFIGEAAS